MAVIGAGPDGPSEVVVAERFESLIDRCRRRGASAVGIDMPIGFAVEGGREAERLARARLGRRACTLFSTPAHAVLAIDDWPEALATNRTLTGKGFSKQAFHLLTRCREVRATLQPADQPWCSEVHPESSFTAMNDGTPLASKHRDEGHGQRVELITSLVGADAVERIEAAGAPSVDGLDAYAAAWTARRLAQGRAEILGSGSDPDGYALTIAV